MEDWQKRRYKCLKRSKSWKTGRKSRNEGSKGKRVDTRAERIETRAERIDTKAERIDTRAERLATSSERVDTRGLKMPVLRRLVLPGSDAFLCLVSFVDLHALSGS